MRVLIEDADGREIAVIEGTEAEVRAALDMLLDAAREIRNPRRRAVAEDRVIRAMSYVDATRGAEHTVRTGRKAGGGRLTKGS